MTNEISTNEQRDPNGIHPDLMAIVLTIIPAAPVLFKDQTSDGVGIANMAKKIWEECRGTK